MRVVGVPDDYKGLGLLDHMSSGDRGARMLCVYACVCISVYGRVSAGLSIHVNTAKTPEGADVCHSERRRGGKKTVEKRE